MAGQAQKLILIPKSNVRDWAAEAAENFLFHSLLLRTRGREVLRRNRGDRRVFNY